MEFPFELNLKDYTIEGFMSRQVSAAFRGFLLGTYPIGTTVTNPNNVTFFSDSSNNNLTFHDLGDGTVLTAGNFDSNINFRGNPGNLAAGLFSIGFLNATQDQFTVNKNGDHIFILDRGIRGFNSSLPVSTGLPGAIDATADVEEI